MQIVFGSIIGAFYTPFWAAYGYTVENFSQIG
jgi:nucleoside recognition membrane protein YjiH